MNSDGILGYNNDSVKNPTTDNDMYWLLFISMFISIISSCLLIVFYQKYWTHSLTELAREGNLSNETNGIQSVHDLPNLKAIKPYVTLYIHRQQAQFALDELITEATRTKRFTIVPDFSSARLNLMLLHIELIQDTQTIIALVEYCSETDRNSRFFYAIRRFFINVFGESKIIQTWGSTIEQLTPYVQYGLFSINEVTESQSLNIQKEFKPWYNRTFRHLIKCPQYLKYEDIDGSHCSCSHRPYKTSSSSQWSLSKAIAYTFDECLGHSLHKIHKCLAITKLAHAIDEKWTRQQLMDYKQRCHTNQNVSDATLL